MMRVFLYGLLISGFLPLSAVAQGITTEAEVYDGDTSIGGLISKQTEYYSQDAPERTDKLPQGRVEYYTGIGDNVPVSEESSVDMDYRVETLSGDMSLGSDKTSEDYKKEYERVLEEKGEMVKRHRKEMDKLGDSLQLRQKQFKELHDLTQEGNKYRDLERAIYKKEREFAAQVEAEKWEADNAEHIYRYGVPLPEVEKYQRTYDRVKREIEQLKEKQFEERKKRHKSFDKDNRHLIELGRLDDDLHKAREELDAAKRRAAKSNLDQSDQ
jgi:hypothetical protein